MSEITLALFNHLSTLHELAYLKNKLQTMKYIYDDKIKNNVYYSICKIYIFCLLNIW